MILVDNGRFTAAAIAYNERKFNDFTRSDDRRPKTFYTVSASALLSLGDSSIAKLLKDLKVEV